MLTIAVICEYNPFHNGHKYQLDAIRKEFGEDCCIIALMSGNYTQRGDVAILDKGIRARCATDAGANLVLEIPFPFSISSAELFALAGVRIANSLNTVDYLSFGSECGDIGLLEKYAEAMLSDEYKKAFADIENENSSSAIGHARLCEKALKSILEDATDIFTPNNILALEYIKALKLTKSRIKPHTIKRVGAGYNDSEIGEFTYQSASAIRESVKNSDITALEYVPEKSKKDILEALKIGEFPCDTEKLATAIISHFRINPVPAKKIHDAEGGLYNRLAKMSGKTGTISQLVRLTETKKYTNARIRRAIFYSYFGVTSSDIKEKISYTQVLAMDGIGRAGLKEIKKRCNIAVLTKPSDHSSLSKRGLRQKALADKADAVFQLTKPIAQDSGYSLRFTPYVKK